MKSQIKTAGQLRQFLADSIIAVKNKQMDTDTAKTLVKLAGQLNESFYAELKAKQVLHMLEEQTAPLGSQALGDQGEDA